MKLKVKRLSVYRSICSYICVKKAIFSLKSLETLRNIFKKAILDICLGLI